MLTPRGPVLADCVNLSERAERKPRARTHDCPAKPYNDVR
jgi:hypothetical protein